MFLTFDRICTGGWALAAGFVLAMGALAPVISMPVAAAPEAKAEEDVAWPETVAARCAQAFIAVLNDPTAERIAAFEKSWASASRRSARSVDDRLAGLMEMKHEHGSYVAEEILASAEHAITVLVRTENGAPMEMEFRFSEAEPGKLDAVMIATGGAARPEPITADDRDEIIADVLAALREGYVYPEVAEKMAESIDARRSAGAYANITTDVQLARQLTDDLRAVSHDGHLGVRVMPGPMPSPDSAEDEDQEEPEDPEFRAMMRRENYGFRKTELLPNNIGYLRFDHFADDDEARAIAAAGLNFLAHADALIFDMRYNGGGSPEMIRFITSWLFESPTHLNSMIDRQGETVEEYWTLEEIPHAGKRFPSDLPVYVLTSARTFSGAEEFSYNLKNLKRAIIVGETTGGGAHPVMGKRISDRIVVMVPFMRAWNPISRTNWEGTGVEPDVKCSADKALEVATGLAHEAIERRRQHHD